jgi:2-keto-4-pentenoate hydratase/2-oxohepta-3-ene-1,7-dioic acid hydratase in catechol pathway
MQDEDAADMIFNISQQIEYISRYARLLPGDLICTGSPAGNGTHYNRFLKPGDLMVGEITGLGRQAIRCVAAGSENPTNR